MITARTVVACVLGLSFATPAPAAPAGRSACPPDTVRVGTVCVDRYEASVWQISPGNAALLRKVLRGRVTRAELEAGGATQLSRIADFGPPRLPPYPPEFPADGNWTPAAGSDPPSPGVYAVSIAGVLPSHATWQQAEQACALAGKRLLSNQEWQRAAVGTPEPGFADDHATTCNTFSPGPVETGSRAACVSSWGVYDMVGNVSEWVGEWVNAGSLCGPPGWPGCGQDALRPSDPSALGRGGLWYGGPYAAILSLYSALPPDDSGDQPTGFRCGR